MLFDSAAGHRWQLMHGQRRLENSRITMLIVKKHRGVKEDMKNMIDILIFKAIEHLGITIEDVWVREHGLAMFGEILEETMIYIGR